MSHWTNLKTWKTARFTVALDWTYEDSPDLSWDESGETAAKIDSGEWINCTFRVRVLCDGTEVGTDYLGNSIYANPIDFYREHIGIGSTGFGCYFTDMMHSAIAEARNTLRNRPYIRANA